MTVDEVKKKNLFFLLTTRNNIDKTNSRVLFGMFLSRTFAVTTIALILDHFKDTLTNKLYVNGK